MRRRRGNLRFTPAARHDGRDEPWLRRAFTALEEIAGLFVVMPGAGHYPRLDDADRFTATTAAFLG